MHQVPADVWNQIAEQQPLATDWAKQVFPMPGDQMDVALEREEERLGNDALAAAYLKVMPLLWERTAISNFLKDNPSLRWALPEVISIAEAVHLAKLDFQSLTEPQLQRLGQMLKKPPH